MLPEPSKEKNHARDVQRSLFADADLDEARLPRRPEAPDYSRAAPPPARPAPRRHASNQPSLPFGRPQSQSRVPTNDRTQAVAPPASQGSPVPAPEPTEPHRELTPPPEPVATGEVARAKELLGAIRVLKEVERAGRSPDAEEARALARFGGFGPVALSLFPNPVTGDYKSPSWQRLGEELLSLLTDEEYASAKRTVFTAFYTSPVVVRAMYHALTRLGVPNEATVLEPGCGSGNFLRLAPEGMHVIGIELDSLSGRIARALHPRHEVRIESFRDTRLSEGTLDAVIGNPPFADVKHEHRGERYSLHDYVFVKSLDAVKPGGILALVTTHYTLDKQNGQVRERLAERADFLGAIRLPSDAFAREGTKVVTDLVFLRKRGAGEPAAHSDPSWLEVLPLAIEGVEVPINRYFHEHPEMVLGTWSRKDRLYGGEQGFSVEAEG